MAASHCRQDKVQSIDPVSDLHCEKCALAYAPSLLACPQCGSLTYADELKKQVAQVKNLESQGDLSGALSKLRSAEALLPRGSSQGKILGEYILRLSGMVSSKPSCPSGDTGPENAEKQVKESKTGFKAVWAWLVGLGALGFKLKTLLLLILGKGKLLLMGLKSGTTVLTMLASLGVYWTIWGWKFALGFVLSIYVHEMGHVITLRRYGIAATAPMFIPGVGALVRLKANLNNPIEDARCGAAGPAYGLGAALVCLLVYYATDYKLFGALAWVGAWINLFNLLPIPPLDGGRSFASLSKKARLVAATVATVCALVLGGGVVPILVAALAWYRAFVGTAPKVNDRVGTFIYLGLLVSLSALTGWGRGFDNLMQ